MSRQLQLYIQEYGFGCNFAASLKHYDPLDDIYGSLIQQQDPKIFGNFKSTKIKIVRVFCAKYYGYVPATFFL